jgi:hypothetical protein
VPSDERLPRFSAWLLFATSVTLAAIGVAFMVLNRNTADVPASFAYRELDPVISLVFAAIGLLLALRVPGNAVGWLLCLTGILAVLNNVSQGSAIYGLLTDPGSLPLARFAAWLHNWLWVPLIGIAGVFLLLLFPTGQILPRYRPVGRLAAVSILVAWFGVAFEAGELEEFEAVQNPLGFRPARAGYRRSRWHWHHGGDCLRHSGGREPVQPLPQRRQRRTPSDQVVCRFRDASGLHLCVPVLDLRTRGN